MTNQLLRHLLLGLVCASSALHAWPVSAVPMINDPKGFQNIEWGAALAGRDDVAPARTGSHISEYRSMAGPAIFAGAEMTSILLLSVDDQFARVTIRYQGEQTHAQVMKFLETQFGPLERIPGQMARGLNQQYNWRGPETEINVTYQANTERGFIFIDSRTLAPRFNDHITDSAE
ncbi:MAG: conserved exported protein of unknown function [Nitrospira sp.]|nr:MAG: conserved exported protein of unknown function [Nitrospira sp.]